MCKDKLLAQTERRVFTLLTTTTDESNVKFVFNGVGDSRRKFDRLRPCPSDAFLACEVRPDRE